MTQLYVHDIYVITLPERAIPYTSNIIFLGTVIGLQTVFIVVPLVVTCDVLV